MAPETLSIMGVLLGLGVVLLIAIGWIIKCCLYEEDHGREVFSSTGRRIVRRPQQKTSTLAERPGHPTTTYYLEVPVEPEARPRPTPMIQGTSQNLPIHIRGSTSTNNNNNNNNAGAASTSARRVSPRVSPYPRGKYIVRQNSDDPGLEIIPVEVGPSVNVTTTTTSHVPTSASPMVIPPYPVEPRHPTPHVGAPAPGFAAGVGQPPYPTQHPYPPTSVYYPPPFGASPYPPPAAGPGMGAPYPPVGAAPAPYPPAAPPGGGLGGHAPYPPMSAPLATHDPNALPPSYSEAVGGPPSRAGAPPLTTEVYSKQAPFNPDYN